MTDADPYAEARTFLDMLTSACDDATARGSDVIILKLDQT